MYGKIFDSMYDGTLSENWQALVTFQQMIVLCDADGVIDMTPAAISRRTGIPIDHIKVGIEILENPDENSRTEDEEGRRIVRLDDHRAWGWRLVNYRKFQNIERDRCKSAEWQELRTAVFHRDNFTCAYCGHYGGSLECDHIVPVSKGGSDDLDNLATACRACNRSKGAKDLESWRVSH